MPKGSTARRTPRRFAVRAAAAAAATSLAVGAIGAGAAASSAATLRPARIGEAPALMPGAHWAGRLTASTRMQLSVVMRPRSAAALSAFAAAVSSPGSSQYRDYISRREFTRRFGPTSTAIHSVESDLKSAGLHVGALSPNHLSISVHGTAGAVERAFGIAIGLVREPSGRLAYTNVSAPRFSGAAARAVQGVIGLNNLYLPHRESVVSPKGHRPLLNSPHVVTGGPQPCSTAVSDAPGQDAYTADQLASAYRFSSLYGAGDEGSGVSVALYELEPNLTSDIAAYQSCYGTSTSVTYTKVDSGSGTGAGEGEAALDIEDVIGLAPKASIDVYQGPNSDAGAYDTYNAIVSADTSKVVSTSWGLCESSEGSSAASEENTLFQEAATQGQTIFSAAGDDGSSDCGTSKVAVDDPASQPYVTGVGGTTMSAIGPSPTEKVWNDSSNSTGAGGGGISTLWTMPTWQSGAPSSLNVINSNSSGTPCKAASGSYCREVPDVTADADPYTGYLIYYDGSWTGIGGTSAAAPLWAAFAALTDASASCAGKPIGFANPTLYKVAASAYSSDFQDITSGNNDYTPDGYKGGLYPSGTAYDMASGLGSPNGANLPAGLCSGGGTTGNTVTVTNPGAQTTTVGKAVSLQITATDSASGQTLTYSATGLPAGLSISSSSGLISGTPTTSGSNSVTVTAKDTTGASGSASFTWTVNPVSSCTAEQLLGNPGFETGKASPWTATSGVIESNSEADGYEVAQAGSWFAWLDGYGEAHTDTLAQTVTLPSGCSTYTFSFYKHIDTFENTTTAADDTLKVQVLSGSTVLSTLATYSNLNAANGYQKVSFSLAAYAGETIKLKFTGTETDKNGGTTDFTIDSTGLNVS